MLQGPFGGGLSSAELVSAVSNAGGLGVPLRKVAVEQGKSSLLTFWAGQKVSLIRHRNAKALMAELLTAFEN